MSAANPAPQTTTTVVRCSFQGALLPVLLDLQISLLVTTYQAGKLFIVRADGDVLNTHFRNFNNPMGLALDRRRLAVGTKNQIWEFRNQPEVARKLEPAGKHDGCFLPRLRRDTGDIRVHELAFAQGELWAVNTRFSCLCTFDDEHSFVPRWRPAFVTALAPEDRCHLNGLVVINDRPKYVTALGATDTPGGWRDSKANGGLLLDIDSGEVVARGLSMPHSPRWHDGQLWLLESGDGTLARADAATGRWETLARVPGFTRGLDFHGRYAFVGLSQVRETATFGGIPLTERLTERVCGVWVIDTHTGQTVGSLRFEAGVQEIFAVLVLAGTRFPDVIAENDELLSNSFMVPAAAMGDVPDSVK